MRENKYKQKEAGFGPFLKKSITIVILCGHSYFITWATDQISLANIKYCCR